MATEVLTVELGVSSEATITVYDVNGRALMAVPATGNRTEISLDGVRPGVYMLSVQDAETVKTTRIVVR
jgi:hypothetical protein